MKKLIAMLGILFILLLLIFSSGCTIQTGAKEQKSTGTKNASNELGGVFTEPKENPENPPAIPP